MSDLIKENFRFFSEDGREIFVYQWKAKREKLKGVIQISHGMAETAARYECFAKELTKNGFVVYANDHRGHGKSADNINEQGYLGEKNGFSLLIADMAKLTEEIKKIYPNLPIFLFSHSMGSFAAQEYIMEYSNKIKGLILSGSNGEQGSILAVGKLISKIEMIIRGKKAKSQLMNKLTFGYYNDNFKSEATGVEWLTRDLKEQKKYLENPYCGEVFPTSFYHSFFNHLQYIEDKENFHKIPKDLPIFIISGSCDPVGDFGQGSLKLKNRYLESGVKDVSLKLYKGARHELLNELNKKEVMTDIIQWLEKRLEK
ncbi:MAG: alpha/beta hydrolase [Atopostipes sp.]|nr:alpha/beta hydrolase [Atopostipes sp.]